MTPHAATPISLHDVWAESTPPRAPWVPEDDPFPPDWWEGEGLEGVTAPPRSICGLGGILNVSREFLTAGEAIFTVVPDPHAPFPRPHYTYKITKKDGDRGVVFFISSYITSANEDREDGASVGRMAQDDRADAYAWSYVGLLMLPASQVKLTGKSKFTLQAAVVRVLWRALDAIAVGRAPMHWQILHSGSCGRCGRTLTTPASLASGIGPECAKLIAEGR